MVPRLYKELGIEDLRERPVLTQRRSVKRDKGYYRSSHVLWDFQEKPDERIGRKRGMQGHGQGEGERCRGGDPPSLAELMQMG